jgi:hypothetical protein
VNLSLFFLFLFFPPPLPLSLPFLIPVQGIKEFQVIGRARPTDANPKPKIFRMRLFAPDDVRARSRFWYFLGRVERLKKPNGEVLACNEVRTFPFFLILISSLPSIFLFSLPSLFLLSSFSLPSLFLLSSFLL